MVERISVNESYLWLVDAATGEKKPLTPRGGGAPKVAYQGGEFARDGKAIYVTTDKDSEFHRLARVDLAGGAHTFLTTPINWDVDEFELSPDGKTIAFVANEDGVDVLHLLDTATGKERPAPRLAWASASSARSTGTRTGATSASRSPRRGRPWTSTPSTSPPARSSAGPRARRAG